MSVPLYFYSDPNYDLEDSNSYRFDSAAISKDDLVAQEQNQSFFQHSLHILVLSGFVLAQPLMQLIGGNVEFLVAQRIEGWEVLVLVLSLSLFIPGVLLVIEYLALLINKTLYKVVHGGFIFLLITALFVLLLKRVASSGAEIISAALIASLCLSYCYHRFSITKTYLNYLSPAIIAFPLLFLVNSQVSKILTGSSGDESISSVIGASTPVVMVIFDELPTTSLLSSDGNIDALRFPNYARLAGDSAWFRAAQTVESKTLESVPAILSGTAPTNRTLPLLSDYPNNLFTFLDGTYSQSVFEPLTQLCPQSLCQKQQEEAESTRKYNGLFSDLVIVYAHLIFPADMAQGLPDISSNWNSFGVTALTESVIHGVIPSMWGGQRAQNFSDFVTSIEQQEQPTLNFIHVLLPHQRWEYLPSGKRYYGPWGTGGLANEQWEDNEWLVTQGYQRHLLQVQYTDTLLGNMLDKLEKLGLYDESLVIVTADHGASFWPGFSRRKIGEEKYREDLMNVPLFVKLPNQQYKGIYDFAVKSTDIAPTIADILGEELNWRLDGSSVLAKLASTASSIGRSTQFQASESLLEKYRSFNLSDSRSDFYNIGPNAELIGKNIAELEVTTDAATGYQLDQREVVAAVDLNSAMAPSLLTGRILEQSTSAAEADLAIVLNGVIVAVTKTYQVNKAIHFSAMVSESQFQNGNNQISLYTVARQLDGFVLNKLRNRYTEQYDYIAQNEAGNSHIESDTGKLLELSAGHLVGTLEKVEVVNDRLVIVGWAIDKEHSVGADYLLLDIAGQLSYAVQVSGPRPDVNQYYKLPESELTGFSFAVPMNEFSSGNVEVKLLAVSDDGHSSEILVGKNISDIIKEALQ